MGLHMAVQELAACGDRVVICGRDEKRLAAATAALRQRAGRGAQVHGFCCDVSNGHGERIQSTPVYSFFRNRRLLKHVCAGAMQT